MTINNRQEHNQVAIITGGAGGIGTAIARRFAQSGIMSALWDIDLIKAENIAKDIQGAVAYRVDVTDYQDVESAAQKVADDFGRIDILVNSAGINGPIAPLVDYPIDEWHNTMKLNLDGMFYCCRAVIRIMLKNGYGRVVNMSSTGGKEGNPNGSCYAASKSGVIGMTKALGKELAKTNICVNCVTPAAIDTEMLTQLTPEFKAHVLAKIPMGRFGRAEEVADLVNWLASEECSFSTGAVFDISGGRSTY